MRNAYGWMVLVSAGLTIGCGADDGRDSQIRAENNTFDESNNYAANGQTNGGIDYNGAQDAGLPDPIQAGETYNALQENDWVGTDTEATSTFSIDVDNASYTLARSDLRDGRLPHPDGVRVEEYINFFDYGYPQPGPDDPFSISMEIAPSPFGNYHLHAEEHTPEEAHPEADGELHLLRIGLQGRAIELEDMKPTNLVFLIDTSGSMQSEAKLPLVKATLNALVGNLRADDTIGIVTYAGSAGVLLEPTAVSDAATITTAINNLNAGGSTNGEAGIESAYRLAESAKIEGGNNRVIIATDGDFNVGRTGDDLVQLVRDYRDQHISLTAVGYGHGNYNDATMESLAHDGNGNYFYIDSMQEAERVFGTDLPSTLEVIAADVKIQVEFATDAVVRYRLVGYENRVLANEDFADDTKDAGEIGPGHTVTALYELELAPDAPPTSLLAEVRLRHKAQYGADSVEQIQSIKQSQIQTATDATPSLLFAAAVAEFAEILRHSQHSTGADFAEVERLATLAAGGDSAKTEFIDLVGIASDLWQP